MDFQLGGVPVTVLRTASTQVGLWASGEAETLLRAFERVLSEFRPDVLLSYGGDAVAQAMIGLAKQRGVTVVFWLHNFAYNDPAPFRDVDHTIVPSEFSGRYYRERLGLECVVMPYATDWARVRVGQHRPTETPHPNPLPQGERGFVTFVNPQPAKGLFVFARIAEQLAGRRPDIPLLVVESRGAAAWLEQTGLDLSWATNLHAMDNTHDPRDFYAVSKLLLVPSLWNESFGLVAAEAMINGIPVLASNRGALPEVVGGVGRSHGSGIRGQGSEVRPEGGFLFEIPARYTPETTLVPTAEEVEPWVETIIRLWDDEALFRKCSDNARTHALQWHPDRVGPIYAEFFRTLPLSPEERGVNQVTPLSREGRGVQSELTSIVIVTLNQLDHTKLCIESIQRHTTEPYELIFVDNGSSDGTVGYLRSIPNAKLIVNAANRGFPAAANQGLQAGSGRQSLLLNNDTIVTPGWLTRLLRALYSDPTVGMVGPCSNFVSGPQQIPVPYHDLDEIHRFARDWGEANEGRRIETDRLVGFCLLIRREVVERIGLLDERYGIGNFEDDDYCLRARQAGYRLVITRDAFVHHFGGATFIGSRVDHGTLMRRNQRLFQQKWRAARGQRSEVRGQYPTDECRMTNDETPTDHGPLTTDQVLLSLCMIARDNERTIGAALEGIRPWVDEMVVVDTGSNDATPQIAESLGARAFHFSWCDDFSAARNESIRHAGGRWIFWMDTDDTIDAENGRKLRELVSRQWSVVSGQLEKTLPTREPTDNGQRTTGDPPVLGYLMKVRCPATQANGEVDFIEVDQVKLFRNLPALRFEGRIHEQILMAIRRAGGTVAWTDIFVVHSGAEQSPEGRARKIERDLRILQLDYKERPDHPFVLFNLGMTYAEAGRHEEAIGFLWQSIGRSGSDDSHLRKAYALLVSCYRNLGRHVTAWETCQQGLGRFPEDAELRFRQATLLHQFGRLPEAAQAYESLLHAPQGRHLSSVDWGIKGYRARQNLAVVYADLGDLAKAEEQWHRVVDEVPNYHPGWQGLGETLLRQRKVDEALAVADHLTPSSVVQLGYVLWECGRRAEAIAAWQQALRVAPGDPGATQAIRQAKQTADA